MKAFPSIARALCLTAGCLALAMTTPVTQASDADVSRAKYQFKQFDKAVAEAKAHADNPAYWEQADTYRKGLVEMLAAVPEADRTPMLRQVKEWEPLVAAGVLKAQAERMERRIKSTFERIDEALAGREVPDREIDRMDEYLVDPVVVKGLPEATRKRYAKHLAAAKDSVRRMMADYKARELNQTLDRVEEALRDLLDELRESPKGDHSHLFQVVEGRLGTARSLFDELPEDHAARGAAAKRLQAAQKSLEAQK